MNPWIFLALILVILLGVPVAPVPGIALDGDQGAQEAIGLAVSTGTRGEILPCT
jgi:hypothetical protein